MPPTLSNKYLLTEVISMPYKDRQFDYQVTVSVFGEAITIKNLLLELPPTARKLMFGKQEDEITELSKTLAKVLHYEIPMAFRKQIRIPYLNSCIKKIRATRKTLLASDNLPINPIYHNRWTQALDVILKSEKPRYEVGLKCLRNLLKKRAFKNFIPLEQLEKIKFTLIAPIVRIIIPLQPQEENKAELYRVLALFPIPSNKKFLLEEWHKNEALLIKSSILFGLMPYKNSAVCRMALAFYDNNKLKGHALKYFIISMKVYKHHRFWKLNVRVLQKYDAEASPVAAQIMLESGYLESNLVRLLPDYYRTRLDLNYLAVSLSIFEKVKKFKNLPTPKSLIHLFAGRVTKKVKAKKLIHPISLLLARTYVIQTSYLLTEKIVTGNEYVSNAFINLTERLYENYPNIHFYVPSKLVKHLLLFSNSDNSIKAANSLSLLSLLARKHAKINWMDLFLEKKKMDIFEQRNAVYRGIVNTWLKFKKQYSDTENHTFLNMFVTAYITYKNESLNYTLNKGIKAFTLEQVNNVFLENNHPLPKAIQKLYRTEEKRNDLSDLQKEMLNMLDEIDKERLAIKGANAPVRQLLIKIKSFWEE